MKKWKWISAAAAWSLAQSLFAQGDGTPIVDQTPEGIKRANAALIAKIRPLIDAKKPLSRDDVKKLLP